MYLGIDVGTSGVKAILLAEDGAIADRASAPLTISRPHPSWSEQRPEDWWTATEQAVAGLDPQLRAQVRGIGLAGQMHGAVLLDRNNDVLRPAILWNDGRAQAQCAELAAREPAIGEITGNPCLAGFTAPKLLWVAENEPAVFDQVRTVLLPKDYLRLRMTGEKWSDMSDASGTLWLDTAERRWSRRMLAATDLSEDAMPHLCEGTEATAPLTAAVASRWGMARVPVSGGAGDNAAAAVGVGAVRTGDALLSLGTSGVIFTVTDRLRPNVRGAVHAFAHAVPGRWHQMSVMLSATASLDWGARLIGAPDADALISVAEEAGPETPIFLPYLTGERTPHADPHAKASLLGMTISTGPAEVAKAVLDGVALGLRDGLDALIEAGSAISELTIVGGGSRSQVWGKIIAAALNRPLLWREGGDVGPALGAARLGRLAAQHGSLDEVCRPPPVFAEVEPDPALAELMSESLLRFRNAHKGTRMPL